MPRFLVVAVKYIAREEKGHGAEEIRHRGLLKKHYLREAVTALAVMTVPERP